MFSMSGVRLVSMNGALPSCSSHLCSTSRTSSLISCIRYQKKTECLRQEITVLTNVLGNTAANTRVFFVVSITYTLRVSWTMNHKPCVRTHFAISHQLKLVYCNFRMNVYYLKQIRIKHGRMCVIRFANKFTRQQRVQ